MSYSLPSLKIDIKNQELALRRFAPQRLIFHWEGSKHQQVLFKQSGIVMIASSQQSVN